ncbi:MAG: helix-turn-helix transcriptional regulator [Ruminococcaceae bacterium]|nr:helix-turn-helix transcriptional regulator [Oscillospiraceae bacterium]
MNTTLGKRIAALRHEKGLKQDELAEKLGVSAQAVSKWENDQTCPDISLLPLLAKTLGVSVDELLSGKQENAPAVQIVPASERKNINNMILRIIIKSARKKDNVRINIPMPLVKVGLDIGLNMTQVSSGNEALRNVDLSKILELVEQGVVGNLMDMESDDGDSIQIFVE